MTLSTLHLICRVIFLIAAAIIFFRGEGLEHKVGGISALVLAVLAVLGQ